MTNCPCIMRRMPLACAGAGLLFSLQAHGQIKVQDRSRFCVKQEAARNSRRRTFGEKISETFANGGGSWSLQDYPPLIDPRAGTVFEQAIYTGKWLSRLRLRVFREDYGLTIEYKLNEGGEVVATQAAIILGGSWRAEAKLYSDGHGGISEPSITYYRRAGGSPIQEPDDSRDYVPMFSTVPMYKTKIEIPCAGSLEEAEKVHATQK